MSWFNTVEFYVISGTLAAAAVALAALPRRRRENVLHMLPGKLEMEVAPMTLELWVDENRVVHLKRTGFDTMGSDSAVSLAVNVAGFDITIDERIVVKSTGDTAVNTALFNLDFLGRERYHICYRGADTGVFTAFTLPVHEGVKIRRDLSLMKE